MDRPRTWMRCCMLAAVLALLALPAGAAGKPRDRDRDGMADRWERQHRVGSPTGDPDDDLVSNRTEYRARTDPRDYDTDGDGTEDRDEDPDRDSVDNETEEDGRTHPRRRDSDRDGRRDGREDPDRDRLDNAGESLTEHDAGDPDTDGDGIADGDEVAGTIVAIDREDGLVTIGLARGGEISGHVGPHTDFGCEGHEAEDELLRARGDAAEGEGLDLDAEELDEDYADEGEELENEDELDGEEPDEDEPAACGLDDLEEGMLVHEAELRVTADGPLFVAIEVVD